MRATLLTVAVLVIAGFVILPGTLKSQAVPPGPVPLKCDRACLENLMNQYLAAVVAHDPKRFPALSAEARYTENDQVIDIGDGFWKTAGSRGNYSHYFADPEFGQIAFMGTMREAGAPLLMTVRLRVELGRVTEVETTYYRQGGGGPAGIADMDAKGKPEDFWLDKSNNNLTRQEMIAVANGYFRGLQKNDGKGIDGTGTYPFTNDCHRIENGYATTNRPKQAKSTDGVDAFSMDCLSQFKLGYYFVVQSIHDRRYPLVDMERGVVWSNVVFDQGTVNEGTLSDGRKFAFKGFNRPSSIEVTEAFLIENGKIRQVEMVGSSVPYHLNSPWGGLSDR